MPTEHPYPRWLLIVGVVEIIAIGATGAALLVLINALSGPLTAHRWAEAGGLWLGVPFMATTLMIASGYRLVRRGSMNLGIALTLLPAGLLGAFVTWANV